MANSEKVLPISIRGRKCDLCLTEKLIIMNYPISFRDCKRPQDDEIFICMARKRIWNQGTLFERPVKFCFSMSIGTNDQIHVNILGSITSSKEHHLNSGANNFRRNGHDHFIFKTDRSKNIGDVQKIKLTNKSGDRWNVNQVLFYFYCHCYFVLWVECYCIVVCVEYMWWNEFLHLYRHFIQSSPAV